MRTSSLMLRTMNLAPDSISVTPPTQLCHVQEVLPNFSAVTRINLLVWPARHSPLVRHELVPRAASDQVQECASEEADSNLTTTLNFSFESLIFSSQSSAYAAVYRTFSGMRPRPTVMINRKDYYGRNCNPYFWFRRGYFCGSASMCEWIFCRCFSAGRYERRRGKRWFPPGALSAPKGEWPYTEAPTMWSCPD